MHDNTSKVPKDATSNLHINEFISLKSPVVMRADIPLNQVQANRITGYRNEVRATLKGEDQRLLVVVGPCSIHDETAAYDYAKRLVALRDRVQDKLLIVMRVYFEKPRTTVGWKGLVNDPNLDGTCDIETGLSKGRKILRAITDIGLPCATEFLDPIVPQYTADLISWAAIGARTTESQTHREMASGLSMPVGFKNATDGSMQIALDAMVSSRHPHAFLGIDANGQTAVVKTTGNPDVHMILRGGGGRTNFSKPDIAYAKAMLENEMNKRTILVDCSHGNSNKDFRRQTTVFENLLKQYLDGEQAILGMMLESFIVEGRQDLGPKGKEALTYGQSITDACIAWDATEKMLLEAHARL